MDRVLTLISKKVLTLKQTSAMSVMLSGLSMAATLLTLPVLLATIGQVETGLFLYAKVLSTNGIWQLFDPGLRVRLNRFVAAETIEDEGNLVASDLLKLSVGLLFTIGILVATLALIFSDQILTLAIPDKSYSQAFAVIFLFGVLLWPFELSTLAFAGFLEGHKKYLIVKSIDATFLFLGNASCSVLAIFGFDLISLALTFFAFSFCRGLALFTCCLPHINNVFRRPQKGLRRTLTYFISDGSIFFAGNAILQIYAQLEKIAFVIFFPPAAMAIIEIIYKVPQAARSLVESCRPILIRYLTEGIKKAEVSILDRLTPATQLHILFASALAISVMFNAKFLLDLWVGSQFIYLAPYMSLALAFNIFQPLLTNSRDTLIAKDAGLGSFLSLNILQILLQIVALSVVVLLQTPEFVGVISLCGLMTVPLLLWRLSVTLGESLITFAKDILITMLFIGIASLPFAVLQIFPLEQVSVPISLALHGSSTLVFVIVMVALAWRVRL